MTSMKLKLLNRRRTRLKCSYKKIIRLRREGRRLRFKRILNLRRS